MLFALALAVEMFPWCLNHIFGGYRGRGAIESAAGVALNDMIRWFKILWQTPDAQQFGGFLAGVGADWRGAGLLAAPVRAGAAKRGAAFSLWALSFACGGAGDCGYFAV